MSKHRPEKMKSAGSANTTLLDRIARVERQLTTVAGEDAQNLRFLVQSWRLTAEHATEQQKAVARLNQEVILLAGFAGQNRESYVKYLETVKAAGARKRLDAIAKKAEAGGPSAEGEKAFEAWKQTIDSDPTRARVVCLTCQSQWDVPTGELGVCSHCGDEGDVRSAKSLEGPIVPSSTAPPTPAAEPAAPATNAVPSPTNAPEEPKALDSLPDPNAKD